MEARLADPRATGPVRGPDPREGGEGAALLALVFLLGVTALWWWLALWPDPAQPAWVQHARAVCFGAGPDGLPSTGGWILLIGEPVGMVCALAVLGGRSLRSAGRKLWARGAGRAALVAAVLALAAGATATAVRVAGRLAPAEAAAHAGTVIPINRPVGELGLVDQHGRRVTLAALRGRPVLLTFAFGHCETVCPLLVHDALAVRRALPPAERPALLIVTVDPWRDTPARLPALAERWALGEGEHVLSGPVETAAAVHAGWGAAGARDPRTGMVAHPPLTLVIDPEGRARFRTTGRRAELRAALARLRRTPAHPERRS